MKKIVKGFGFILTSVGLIMACAIAGGSLGIPLMYLTPLTVPIVLWSFFDKKNEVLGRVDNSSPPPTSRGLSAGSRKWTN